MEKIERFFLFTLIIFGNVTSKIAFNFTIKEETQDLEEKSFLNGGILKSFLSTPIESEIDSRTIMNVCLGTEPQCLDLVIQTNSFYLLVSDFNSRLQQSRKKFDYKKSSTIVRYSKEVSLNYYGQKIIGTEAKDVISIIGQTLSSVNFIIVESSGKFRRDDGFIGLGYTPSDEERKFSIVQQLYLNGDIPHKVFSQKYENEFNGKLTIGEIPEYIVKDYYHYGRCRALDKKRAGKRYKNNNWECNLDSIYFGDDINTKKEFENQEVSFLSYRKRSFMPKEIFVYIGNTLLKEKLKQGECSIKQLKRYTFYECKNDTELDTLSFIFDNWEIRIDSKGLFSSIKKDKTKDFIFYYRENYEKFLFGRSFLKEIEMVYDYANKEIGFYHPSVKYFGKEKVKPPKVYKFLIDDDEFTPKKVENGPNLIPEAKPEEVNKINITVEEQSQTYNAKETITILLEFLIALICILIICFLVVYGLKHRKKKKIKEANKYLKKERMLETKISY